MKFTCFKMVFPSLLKQLRKSPPPFTHTHTHTHKRTHTIVGLMDRALDLKPEVTQGCGFESRLPDCSPGAAQSAAHCSKCTLGWVKCREHISLLIILCLIVYVTNKAHPSLICICIVHTDRHTHKRTHHAGCSP